LEADGSTTVIANSFQGRQLNRPNDVVVKSDGSIYFTDPWTSPNPPQQWDLTFSGVYRITPDLGTLSLLVGDFVLPNGLAFSPDESVLYINDTRRGHIRAFDVMPNGMLARASDRVFADLRTKIDWAAWGPLPNERRSPTALADDARLGPCSRILMWGFVARQ